MKYIVVSESARSAQELVAAAKAQGATEVVAVQFSEEDAATVARTGADRVVVAEVEEGGLKESAYSIAVAEAEKAGAAVVLLSTSRRMVNASALVAQALGTAPVVDVKSLDGGAASHIKYGGKIVVADRPAGAYAVFVVSSGSYEPAPADGEPCPVEHVSVAAIPGARVAGRKEKEASSVDLTAAKTIVCVGRGVNTREGFELCRDLQRAVRGEMGCTRPVTETADPFMPRETYIGASGVCVKPDLFISVAASGQTQHTMGMYESGRVVVIDKNKDALFFNACDYGIVGDYKDIVPAITAALGA